jgi:uncharacterized protein involved in propanediol utilization
MPTCAPVRIGYGASIGHHGEIFQGQISHGGQPRRCLVSLPCNLLQSRATFRPSPDEYIQAPPGKQKAELALRLTLRHLGVEHAGGVLTIESNIPERKGCGSSTADCVAAVLAAAASTGQSLSDETVAAIVVGAEGASDNVMFKRAVLFAQRDGIVLLDFGQPLPHLAVLGMDADENSVVDTMDFPPASYAPRDIETFQMLATSLDLAIRARDVKAVGAIATASSVINEQFLPKPRFSDIHRMAHCCGALGIAAAHSGTVLGILLDPQDPNLERKAGWLRLELAKLRIHQTTWFTTGQDKGSSEKLWHPNLLQSSSTLTGPI